jgi:predicted RND superfamily exporter protein
VEARRAAPGDTEGPLRRTFHFAGRAIVMTTVILCVGFAPFVLSDYLTLYMFGTLLPLALVVAVLADLLLVPAMARVGMFRMEGRNLR